ncbi:T9SS C-terminal target domain-containing protein [Aquimarina sp. AD1]|uniref:type IX secretion system anionic LPS delivery protein PorZ n=1 Tax=Aquimarina sp. (strain AD1) TaxID=1714848 RepID=UPI000E4A9F5E|nr:two-component regulator propeller domain-containing protein [Aquimarina sp. AD1]AXT57506.1 T9SS C-terminal target domain-containing protein [Aquimarina sp. AD1]RKN35768.1 T9SS C-terminal target domain-containing protein [Aquimarina sp. AD1]
MRYFRQLILLIFPVFLFSQDFSNQWTGHYSYFQINDSYAIENKIYVASENTIFIYDTDTRTSETFTTVNGLSGETVSTIYHSSIFDITVIGYDNGLLELIVDDEVITFIDILEKPTIPPTQKRINHFFENGNILYVSTEFGIVEFNLERIEFGDTFFVGPAGSQINITGTVVSNNVIYATTSNNGILNANVDNLNLVDFNQWITLVPGQYRGITLFNEEILVWENNNLISRLDGPVLTTVVTASSDVIDVSIDSDNLIVVNTDRASVFDTSFNETTSAISTTGDSFLLKTALSFNNTLYLGTDSRGLLQVDFNDLTNKTSISPEGPLSNFTFGIEASNSKLWVVFGQYDVNFNPFPLQQRGISKLTSEGWLNISKDEVMGATSLSHITINPNNEDQVFISSLSSGLLEINDNVVTNLYNNLNSGFESFVTNDPIFVFLNGSVFDNDGNLWVNNARVDNGLKRFSPGATQTLNVNLSRSIPNALNNLGFTDTVIDRDGNLFVGGFNSGVIGYNTDTESQIQLSGETEGSNLPSDYVLALEVDRNNQLWIGTFRGIRVLFNTSGVFQQSNPQASQIIILDDEGVPQELLFDETITDIEADGSNNKWVATASSGVFYFSSDGQETLAHFTADNSPLPTNNVLDISVDDSTGSVYFATEKGLLEFKGTATGPEDNLDNVVAFPNPVRPGFNGQVTIKGLTSRSNVKITDIEGNLVYEEVSEGGSIQWDTTAFGRHKVASGVYLILVTGEDQAETTVSKLLIVR